EMPELKEILEETYGVILYQEQVMQIANRLAGYSLGEADILRRAMGKKKKEEMAKQRDKFMAGCLAHKVPEKKGEKIFNLMEEFAGYGFNKSHSCAYALLAYQAAYLKTHYPVEFVAAMLTSETGNMDKVVKYIHEARGAGITVLPPDVNTSDLNFTPRGEQIRFGLSAIKNVGENTVRGILEARARLGRFISLFQFCEEIDSRLVNRRVLESLIKSGAMDSLGARRAQLSAVIDRSMERGQRMQRQATSGQHGLFGSGPAPAQPFSETLPDVEEWPEDELLAAEFSTIGFYISGHPLAKHAGRLKELNVTELAALEGKSNNSDAMVAGIVVGLRPMRSKKGGRWAILSLQDMTGNAEVLAFPEAFGRLEHLLKSHARLLIKGRISVEDAGTRVILSDARPLEDVTEPAAKLLRVRVDLTNVDEGILDRLEEIFDRKPGPCRVAFELMQPDGAVAELETDRRVRPDKDLVLEIQELCGADAVELLR
ncbi:MAG: DNA polymerase III subunit alpha, partial [Acidobacteria bacterium]|nr:DNA polymerase III subunit alpha [Acidobacteriota bacterium]